MNSYDTHLYKTTSYYRDANELLNDVYTNIVRLEIDYNAKLEHLDRTPLQVIKFLFDISMYGESSIRLNIDDELLFQHTNKISAYDFSSEVDVNILGHIFENSLNEIDAIKSSIETELVGQVTSSKVENKRKKDGVFYTPKYITQYIVNHTIGKLCEAKKLELGINDDDYSYIEGRRTEQRKEREKQLFNNLQAYRSWLLSLTICDPACGSGAFLNQALDFLMKEHAYIDELQAKFTGSSMVLSDVENSILENNLYGVDINEESIEIAKLSLWLRTAKSDRKLNALSHNLKCGNSLIDDPEIAGDKAFNWQKEFPQVFEKGGF